jgi:hypothetical protein
VNPQDPTKQPIAMVPNPMPAAAAYPPNPPMMAPPMGGYFGVNSQMANCPFCRNTGPTLVSREAGTGTWLLCCGICCVTGCCGPVVFLVDSAQDSIHNCSTCGRTIGVKRVMNI